MNESKNGANFGDFLKNLSMGWASNRKYTTEYPKFNWKPFEVILKNLWKKSQYKIQVSVPTSSALFRNKMFTLDENGQANFPNEYPGLCQHRPGHSLCEKLK